MDTIQRRQRILSVTKHAQDIVDSTQAMGVIVVALFQDGEGQHVYTVEGVSGVLPVPPEDILHFSAEQFESHVEQHPNKTH